MSNFNGGIKVTYIPNITLEDGDKYHITINPQIRRFLLKHKKINCVFITEDMIWEILRMCKTYKETRMFKIVLREIKRQKFKNIQIPYILKIEEFNLTL